MMRHMRSFFYQILCAMIMRTAFVAALLLLPPSAVTQNRPLAFEVASIHPNNSGSRSVYTTLDKGGRFTATNIPIKTLMIAAYKLQAYQIIGGPSWLDSDRYDITARRKAMSTKIKLWKWSRAS